MNQPITHEYVAKLNQQWECSGKFEHESVLYDANISISAAENLLFDLMAKVVAVGKIETTLGELAENYDLFLQIPKPTYSRRLVPAKGFLIGKGKQLHWYIIPTSHNCKYRCFPCYENGETGPSSSSSYCPETKITIIYGRTE